MTTSLSPVAPAATPRDPPLQAASPLRPMVAVESARAVRPVQPDTAIDRARNPSRGERPVGPPPAFEVNVLEDLRQRLSALETEPRATLNSDDASPYGDMPPLQDASLHLDRKV